MWGEPSPQTSLHSLPIRAILVPLLLTVPLQAVPDWENQAVFRINKADPHAVKMPFPDAAGALTLPRMESP